MFQRKREVGETRQRELLTESLISEIDVLKHRIDKLEENEFVRESPVGRLVFDISSCFHAGLYYEYYYNHNKKRARIHYHTNDYLLSYAIKIIRNQAYIAIDKDEAKRDVCILVDLNTGNAINIANPVDFSGAEWRVAKC